jgi:hypothetical protein
MKDKATAEWGDGVGDVEMIGLVRKSGAIRGLSVMAIPATGLVLGACGSSTSSAPPTTVRTAPPSTVPTSTPISIRINLAHTSVVAGTPIKGHAVITNNSGKPVTVETCAANGWFNVGVTNRNISYDPVNPLMVCPPSVRLAPGANRIPFTVSTSYQGCAEVGHVAADDPLCLESGFPPLPAGTYSTKVVTAGLPAGTPAPNTVTVHLVRG